MRELALGYLYREIKRARIALGKAEYRPGVTQEELDNLRQRIEVLEWISAVVLKEEE